MRQVSASPVAVLLSVGEFSAEYTRRRDIRRGRSYGTQSYRSRGAASHFTRGHRNQQGLAVAPTGHIWGAAQIAGGDESSPGAESLRRAYVTYGNAYEMKAGREPAPETHEGTRSGFCWVPSIAPSQSSSSWPVVSVWAGDLVELAGPLSLYRVASRMAA